MAIDVAFVAGWWTWVYTPTESLLEVRDAGALTAGGRTVSGVERLAPDGRFALLTSEAGLTVVETAAISGPQLDDALVSPVWMSGAAVAAVWLPKDDTAALITDDGRVWRWPRGGEPVSSGRVTLPAWLDLAGEAHAEPELQDVPHRYVHEFLARAPTTKAIEVVSRETGEVLYRHEHGNVMRMVDGPGDPTTLAYTSTATSARMELICEPSGSACERRKLPVMFSSATPAFARSPEATRTASCHYARVSFGEIGEGREGLNLGTWKPPGVCRSVSWLDERRLLVTSTKQTSLWHVEKVLGRPLARWLVP